MLIYNNPRLPDYFHSRYLYDRTLVNRSINHGAVGIVTYAGKPLALEHQLCGQRKQESGFTSEAHSEGPPI